MKQQNDEEESNDPNPANFPTSGVPEVMRRLLTLGFSGFFTTQETLRKALGDALPQEWVDFAADQSERTRAEFIERLAVELVRALETADLSNLLEGMVDGRTLELKAELRLRADKKKHSKEDFKYEIKTKEKKK